MTAPQMVSNAFFCAQCQMFVEKSAIRRHFSARHYKYFPFECVCCKEKDQMHATGTEDDMIEHILQMHDGIKSGFLVLRDMSIEESLKTAMEQCPIVGASPNFQQIPKDPILSSNLHLALNMVANVLSENVNATESESRMKQESESQEGSAVTFEKDEIELIPELHTGSPEMRNTKLEDGELVDQQPHCVDVMLNNTEPHAQSSQNTLTENTLKHGNIVSNEHSTDELISNSESIEGSVACFPEASISENNQVDNFLPPDMSSAAAATNNANFTYSRKRNYEDNFCTGPFGNSARRQSLPELSHLSGVFQPKITVGNRYAHGHKNLNVCNRDINGANQTFNRMEGSHNGQSEHTPTFTPVFYTPHKVPNDSSRKIKISQITLFISHGTVSFETSDRCTYRTAPLGTHLSILRKSQLNEAGCNARIVFRSKHHPNFSNVQNSAMVYENQDKFQKFVEQVHSISPIWANGTIEAQFDKYPGSKDSCAIPLSSFCSGLFNKNRSILVCKVLDITLINNWPLSIVSDIVNGCCRCDLNLRQLAFGYTKMRYDLLDHLYQRKLSYNTMITLEFADRNDAMEFVKDMRKQTEYPSGKIAFEFELRVPSGSISNMSFMASNVKLEIETLRSVPEQDHMLIRQSFTKFKSPNLGLTNLNKCSSANRFQRRN